LRGECKRVLSASLLKCIKNTFALTPFNLYSYIFCRHIQDSKGSRRCSSTQSSSRNKS